MTTANTAQPAIALGARLTRVDEERPEGASLRLIGRAQLYSAYRGTYVPIELTTTEKDEAGEKKKKAIKALDEKMQAVWEKASEYLPEDGKNLRVNLSKRFIAYTDAAGEVHYIDKEKEDPAFHELMNDVRALSRKVLRHILFGENSNPEACLETSSEKWASRSSHSLDLYLQNEHLGFGKLQEELSGSGAAAEALDRVVATETFIQEFRRRVHQRIDRGHQYMDTPAFKNSDKAARHKIKQYLSDLQKLANEFSETRINREALYCAVGVWGNADPTDPTIQAAKPREISRVMESILTKDLEPGHDTRGFIKKFKDFVLSNTDERAQQLGMGSYIHLFGQETGDLGVHDRLAYRSRVEQHGERHWNRASSMEFCAHNMIHMRSVDPKHVEWQQKEPPKPTLPSGISFTPPSSLDLRAYAGELQAYLDDPGVPGVREVAVPSGLVLNGPINYDDPTIDHATRRERIASLIALCNHLAWEQEKPPQLQFNPDRGAFRTAEALEAFGVSPSSEAFKVLQKDLDGARLVAAQVLHAAAERKGNTWQERVKKMKKDQLIGG